MRAVEGGIGKAEKCEERFRGGGVSYPGGKSGAGVYQTLINLMPPHEIYIEPFLGMGGVLRRKKPAPIATIGIDADKDVMKLWAGVELPGLSVRCADGIRYLEQRKWTGRELVYCDPPYLMATRAGTASAKVTRRAGKYRQKRRAIQEAQSHPDTHGKRQ